MQHCPVICRMLLVVALVVLAAIGVLWYGYDHPRGSTPVASNGGASVDCMASGEYFVIINHPDEPGLDVVAIRKAAADQAFPCTVDEFASAPLSSKASSVILKNDAPEFVLGIAGGHFLIVDSGTAPPPRGLVIYNLDKGSQSAPVFTDSYDHPLVMATDTVTYWEATKDAVTAGNCASSTQWQAEGLGAVMESQVALGFPSLSVTPLGPRRCEPTQ